MTSDRATHFFAAIAASMNVSPGKQAFDLLHIPQTKDYCQVKHPPILNNLPIQPSRTRVFAGHDVNKHPTRNILSMPIARATRTGFCHGPVVQSGSRHFWFR
jgi:hypothetical protein